jgi:mono/diheme cytochrome c family protein
MRIPRPVATLPILLACAAASASTGPDWSEGVLITEPRANPYGLAPDKWKAARWAGLGHALEYPVEISGALLPWRPVRAFLETPEENPIRRVLRSILSGVSQVRTTDDLFARIGLVPFPTTREEGLDEIPKTRSLEARARMGTTFIDRDGVEAMTLSCSTCHASNLFGRRVLGLTNRFPRANETFFYGRYLVRAVNEGLFAQELDATPGERALYARFRERMRSVGVRRPQTLGLDTSVAQVALSLDRRADDDYASFDRAFERRPRADVLAHAPSDSKPMPWWNVKYKNRWLSDGSVVSGNPILTNLLWNEIGRGTDLHDLEEWYARNERVIREFTSAVFATEAPRFTDFFPAERISLDRARRGSRVFEATCAGCHGSYRKAWDEPGSESLPLVERLRTVRVEYPEETVVKDVGTDPFRHRGMESLAPKLNRLALSKAHGIVVKPQKGYVPPPLVGIWARYPYFHNNSAPSLCAVLTPGDRRPKTYWAGEAIDPERDFDSECVGYPVGAKVPKEWTKDRDYLYDSAKAGMSNLGHDRGIFVKNGVEILSGADKRDVIEFLKTL